MTINKILESENLGELEPYDVKHAYGYTNKNKWVWLPQPENKHWVNVFLESDGLIVQYGKTKSDFQKHAVKWKPPVIVIIRYEKEHRKLQDKYRPIFHDKDSCLIIHAKDTLPITQGNQEEKDGTVFWVKGFAATAEEARKKAALYKKKAGKLNSGAKVADTLIVYSYV